jgi:hypothetical protein
MRAELWLRTAAYLTWMFCGVPGAAALIEGRMSGRAVWVWAAAFLIFGGAFAVCSGRSAARIPRVLKIAFLVAQALAAALVVLSSRSTAPAALFVIIAAELPFVFAARATFAWIVAQAGLVAALFWWMSGPMTALVGGGAFAGFQMFAVSTA